jgi:hypothetical protein
MSRWLLLAGLCSVSLGGWLIILPILVIPGELRALDIVAVIAVTVGSMALYACRASK